MAIHLHFFVETFSVARDFLGQVVHFQIFARIVLRRNVAKLRDGSWKHSSKFGEEAIHNRFRRPSLLDAWG